MTHKNGVEKIKAFFFFVVITECTEGTFGDDCTQTCTCIASNTASCDKVFGNCTCNPGWEGANCGTDIDECALDTDGCPVNSECIDTPGSFRCQCNDGFVFGSDGACRGKLRFLLIHDPNFSGPCRLSVWKTLGEKEKNAGNHHFSPFLTVFSTLSERNQHFSNF